VIKSSQQLALDDIDKSLLRALQTNSNLSNVELAKAVKLSPPATHARVRRLEKEGYIRHYAAVVDREKAGYDLLCFIHISMQLHQLEQVEKFRAAIRKMPEVLECHHITGEFSLLLKVRVTDMTAFRRLLIEKLNSLRGVRQTRTVMVLATAKEQRRIKLD
jgi:DNA-binding Lrp family transcriptional regulator